VQRRGASFDARDPEIAFVTVDLERRDLAKAGRMGAGEVRRMVRRLVNHDELARLAIAGDETAGHAVVRKTGRDERRSGEVNRSLVFRGRRCVG
jgi:hypothetical protein